MSVHHMRDHVELHPVVLKDSTVIDVFPAAPSPAVFVSTEFDSLKGRGAAEDTVDCYEHVLPGEDV